MPALHTPARQLGCCRLRSIQSIRSIYKQPRRLSPFITPGMDYDTRESVDELRERLKSMRRLMEQRKGAEGLGGGGGGGDGSGRHPAGFVDAGLLSVVFAVALLVIVTGMVCFHLHPATMLLLVLLLLPLSLTVTERCFCTRDRVLGMESADCMDRQLHAFPKCLRSDVEVVDLTYNRIRILRRVDLQRYSSIKILYLNQNSILRIEDDAFDGMSRLQVLDLSVNALHTLPKGILKLPSLRSLYLGQNQNMDVVAALEGGRPITSPLDHLDISFNELQTLPDLGILPFLIKYNVSGNNVERLTTKHFAGLCSLKYLVNDNFTATFDDPCECALLEKWLTDRKVTFGPFDCEVGVAECDYAEVPEEHMGYYKSCQEIYEAAMLKGRLMKILIPIAVILLVACLVALYIVIKKRKRKKKKITDKLPPAHPEGRMLI